MENYLPKELGSTSQTATTIELHWTVEENVVSEIDHFNIRYHPEKQIKWKNIETDAKVEKNNLFRVSELKSDTYYEFKVRAVLPNGDESPFSNCQTFKTTASLAEKIKQENKIDEIGSLSIYQTPLIEEFAKNEKNRTRKCRLITSKVDPGKKEKTIIVVGASGAGKSTLIDGMLNYYLDVAWEDDARFKLINLTAEEQEKRNEAESQTEWITCYMLPWKAGCGVAYNLNVIDTPGFGDCRGITRDKELVEQIEGFFSASKDQGIDCLDAVWFVVQAPMCRLSPTQRYIFDSILSIFGNDIKENIFILITFADGQRPPVLDAIQEAEIPSQEKFIFNNSALFVDPNNTPNGQLFWKMGKQGFEKFFNALKCTQTRSLTLTKEVLRIRKQLEDDIARIQNKILEGTEEQLKMREEERVLIQHERDIADNKNFEYTVKEVKVVKKDLHPGLHTTTCLVCNFTCHENCAFADDDQKMLCSSMEQTLCPKCLEGNNEENLKCSCMQQRCCTVCINKCLWNKHKNQPYLVYPEEIWITKTYEDMKAKYLSAKEQVEMVSSILEKIKTKYNEVMEENEKLVANVKDCINKLKEIALKPNPISEIEYINILIENETDGRRDGYKERVKILAELRDKAEVRAKIIENPNAPILLPNA